MKLYEIADPKLAKGMARRIMRDYDLLSDFNSVNYDEEFEKFGIYDINRVGNKKLKKIIKEILFKKFKNNLINVEDKGKYGIYTFLAKSKKKDLIAPIKIRFNFHPQLIVNRGATERDFLIPVYIHFHALEQTFHRHVDKANISQIKNTFGSLINHLIKPNIFTKVLNFLKAQPNKKGTITLSNGLITMWKGNREDIVCITVLKDSWKDQVMPPEIKI